MRTRKEVTDEIQLKQAKITELENDIMDLRIERLQICDDEKWYKEEMESHHVSGKGKNKKMEDHMIGRVHWNETFTDGDTGEKVVIERSAIARVNGVWQL